jgi:acetyl esterase/lipase/lysophospholipase L1-like esterase
LAKPVKLHVYTIGDSTVQFWPPANYPKTGWGQVIQHFFNPESVVFHNEARGGTSSKSFYNKYWANTLKQLNAGDFVFIQFGINDMNTNAAIHTVPMTEFKDYLTKYVEETRDKGAYPVLMTPMQWNKLPRGGSWGLYPEAIRQSANALNMPLVDLDTASAALRDSVGTNYSTQFIYMNLPAGAYSNYPAGNIDNTHLQEMGAIEMARLVVQGVKNLATDPYIGKLISGLNPTYKVTFTGNNCAGLITRTESFPAGVTVTAKAIPYVGFGFTGWRGDLNSTNAIASFVMDAADKTVEAKFNAVSGTYLLPDGELMKQAEPITYKVTPQENLRLYVLRPPGHTARPLPAIVYFTGGGWVNGTPDGMIANAAWWRDQGIIGITADYRVKNRHGTTPLECVKDGKSAIRYIRAHARELGIDPDRIIAAGGSAGGHVAAATELPGNDETNEDLQVSSKPDALVLHNPVLGEEFGVDFFTAHPDCSPILGVGADWPPTILSCGTLDHTTPYPVAEQFVQRMKAAGNVCVLITVNNAEHSCDWPATNANFLPNMTRMAEFLRANKIILSKYEGVSSASHPSANYGHAGTGADLAERFPVGQFDLTGKSQ